MGLPVKFDNPDGFYKIRRKGNIVSALNAINGEPVLILVPYPAGRFSSGGYLIQRSRIGRYVDESGNPTARLAACAAIASKLMGFEPMPHQVNLVMDAILAAAADLRAMAPVVPAQAQVH